MFKLEAFKPGGKFPDPPLPPDLPDPKPLGSAPAPCGRSPLGEGFAPGCGPRSCGGLLEDGGVQNNPNLVKCHNAFGSLNGTAHLCHQKSIFMAKIYVN